MPERPSSDDRPKVLLLACGGTIASVASPTAGAIPRLSAGDLTIELRAGMPELRLEARTFSIIPSPHTTLDEVLRLHREIVRSIAADPGIRGVVVTHGTDTLEEVAYALDLLWDRSMPIVVTGAMRNPNALSPDGMANMAGAVATAQSPGAQGLGVLVVLNDEIHAARFVRKGHPSNVATFESPTVGRIGHISEGTARLLLSPRSRASLGVIPVSVEAFPVALHKVTIGDDGRNLRHILPDGYRGLVMEALGGGHVTPAINDSDAFAEILRTIPVVMSTRSGTGEPLRSTYAFAGSETDLRSRGVISSGVLDGPKARVLLTLLLAAGVSQTEIADAFVVHGMQSGEP